MRQFWFYFAGFTVFENVKHLDQSYCYGVQPHNGLEALFSSLNTFLLDIYDDNYKKILTNFISLDINEVIKQSVKILIVYTAITLDYFYYTK